MQLTSLISTLPETKVFGITDIEITDIVDDSRNVKKGSLFIALKGLTIDSHKFIPQVINAGAVAILGEEDPKELELKNVTYIKVKNSRFALGILSSQWFGNPSTKLKVIGVTGTEGKTTTASLIYHIFQSTGKKTGLVSTLNAKIGNKTFDTGLHVTNPQALPLQELLSKMVEEKCEYAVLETTSIGLHQGRVAGVKYHLAVLTNITSDHLDYHKDLTAYREAKALLFKNVDTVILNKDDKSFAFIKGRLHKNTHVYSYGINKNADVKAENIIQGSINTKFSVYFNGEEQPLITQLIGKYNISNILAAIATALSENITFSSIHKPITDFHAPEGRLERIDEGQDFGVFVDFAHTANSVKNILSTLKEVTPKDKKLIAVYGSAGQRDSKKRPEMGKWGGYFADITVFTADDSRTEDVNEIINKMADGALNAKAQEVTLDELTGQGPVKGHVFAKIPNRRNAIEFAINIAKSGDIVALLGKGHEKSLAVGNEEIPWSDQEEARKALREAAK